MPINGQTQPHARAAAITQYDLFLSYNRNDCVWARRLASELKKRDLRVWMDELNLVPGDLWQKEIASALGHANAVAVLIGPSGLGGWQELELQLALAKQPERNVRIVPVPLPGAPSSLTGLDLLAPFQHCDLRESDRAPQLDKLVEVLLHERELRAQDTLEAHAEPAPNWLVDLFQHSGKTLIQQADAQVVPVPQQDLSEDDRQALFRVDWESELSALDLPETREASTEVANAENPLRENKERERN